MPNEPLEFTFRFGRGINLMDAPALMQEGQARELENWRITGQGRLSPRRSLRGIGSIVGFEWCGIFPFPYAADAAAAGLAWDGDKVNLYRIDATGTAFLEGALDGYGSGVTDRPRFTGAVLNQVLFLADVDKVHGLTFWDPNLNMGASEFRQPTFDFDGDATDWGAAKPNIVHQFNGHLWIFGHGEEDTPDRGDVARFSYLGLVADGQGTGDAGTGGVGGSTDLFDLEDVVPVCAKGESVRNVTSAGNRMVVKTNRATKLIYGTDRDTWRAEEIDDERGCANELAGCELGGVDYWMSELGPCRYRGGGVVEPLEARIIDLVETMDMSSVVAVARPEEYQARFYYRRNDDAVEGADRCLIWDERAGGFLTDRHPVRIFCAGWLRPGTLEGPAGAATALTHDQIGQGQARATWTPGDTSPDTTQIVWIGTSASGPWVEVGRYDGGVTEHLHTGLAPETQYWTKVDTIRNGQSPSSGEPVVAGFTTQAEPVDPEEPGFADPPEISVEDYPTFGGGQITQIQPNVLVTISLTTGTFELERKLTSEGSGAWTNIYTSIANPDQYLDSDVQANQSYDYRARNVLDGNASAYTATKTVTPTLNNPN